MKNIAKGLVIGAVLAVATSHFFHIPLGWSMLAFLVAWPVLGLIITADDDLPGGWSNPDGKTLPPWKFREFWGELLLRSGISGIGFAIEAGLTTHEGLIQMGIVAACVVVAVVVIRSGTIGFREEANDV